MPKGGGILGADVRGSVVEKEIDQKFVPKLRAAYPQLDVRHSTCPATIDLSPDLTTRCTIDAGGTSLAIDVRRGERTQFVIAPAARLLLMDDVERQLRTGVRSASGLRLTVHCGEPRVRAVLPNERIRCWILRTPRGDVHVELIAQPAGDIHSYIGIGPISGLPSRSEETLRRYAHPDGTEIVPGDVLARFVRGSMSGLLEGEAEERKLIGRTICPARSDVSTSKHVTCRVLVAGKPLPVDVSFDSSGLSANPTEVVVDTARVRAKAARYYQDDLVATGLSITAIDCGPDRIVIVTPGTSLPCSVHLPSGTFAMTVTVTSLQGEIVFGDPNEN